MNQSEFEKKLEELATQELGDHYYPFWRGARWAREETLREVLEALRSDPLIDGRRLELEACHWADWLEERFKGDQCKKESV